MTNKEKMQLWSVVEISNLSPEMSIVRNLYSGKIMIKRVSDPTSIDTMRRLCGIKNKNLMEIYDADIIGGVCVTLGEYVQGTTLGNLVEQRGAFSERETVSIIVSICTGLKSLHQHDIVHRDINPNNVMIDNTECVKKSIMISHEQLRNINRKTHKSGELQDTLHPNSLAFNKQTRRQISIHAVH